MAIQNRFSGKAYGPFMKYRLLIAALLPFFAAAPGSAQQFDLFNNKKKVDIPFEYTNNFIIVDVLFNRRLPLKFIFDTGAEHTILAKNEIAQVLGLPFEREFNIIGADLSTLLTAFLSRNVSIRVGELTVPRNDILVLQEDYFNFEEYTGILVHGILGADFFKRFVVKINYERKLITLLHPSYFSNPGPKYKRIPIKIIKNKPYLNVQIGLQNNTADLGVRLLIDSGASLFLLLHNDTHPALQLPEQVISGNIGRGLGGYMEGYLGRVNRLKIGDQFSFNSIITSFQDILIDRDSLSLSGRNGIIGNNLLSRFTLIIDYIREELYLKPSKNYNKGFQYDRSGLVIIASGANLSTFVIREVIEGSPADLAGLEPGDRITGFNCMPVGLLTLSFIVKKLQSKVGKTIKLKIKRKNGEKLKVKFKLRDLI